MKIKRTKPGTKTSEAKHEIVKAELNGTASSDDSNNSNSVNNKKHGQQQSTAIPSQQIAAGPVSGSPAAITPTNKRGNSSHRRDKTRDKMSHSQRDKGGAGNGNGAANSTNDVHGNASTANSDRSCGCPHDMNGNSNGGILQSCGSQSCIRIRATDPLSTSASLAQRVTPSATQNNSK